MKMTKVILLMLVLFVYVAPDDIPQLTQTEKYLLSRIQILESKINKNDGKNCGDDWISYSDTKCFKVLNIKKTETEAKDNCLAIDNTSTLMTIASKAEQDFISEHLKAFNNVSANAWIGLEYISGTFKWVDGMDSDYKNWDENASKDGTNKCVQLSLSQSDLGEWTDDNCDKNYLVVCQKKQTFKNDLAEEVKNQALILKKQQTDYEIQKKAIEDHKKTIDKQQIELTKQQAEIGNNKKTIKQQKSQLEALQDSTVPIGFVYTQLPYTKAAYEMWPKLRWVEISNSYQGHFFRVVGGNASSFGSVQNENCPRLVRVNRVEFTNSLSDIPIAANGQQSSVIDAEHTLRNDRGLQFTVSNDEVRPINMAIRLWKRYG